MSSQATAANHTIAQYWSLIKSRQTFLLTLTGAAGYLCQRPDQADWQHISSLVISLLLTISGCTVLNMLFDRDIDSRMERTSQRPLATGQVNTLTAALLGAGLICVGLFWAVMLSLLYFFIILAGVGLNVLVYTLWLKRRSAWSILWGGIAGGMPILAGHTLAIGRVDALGLLLTFFIVLWIPSHNLTLGILYSEDYINAGVPTFLNVYGLDATRRMVTISSLLTSILMAATFAWLRPPAMALWILVAASLGLLGMSFIALLHADRPAIARLYKYSSFYMLGSMLLLALARLK